MSFGRKGSVQNAIKPAELWARIISEVVIQRTESFRCHSFKPIKARQISQGICNIAGIFMKRYVVKF